MSIAKQVEDKIRDALEATQVKVEQVSPGHFEISVEASVFDGKSTLQKHRLVLAQVAPFMKGDAAPVHAVDKIETSIPA